MKNVAWIFLMLVSGASLAQTKNSARETEQFTRGVYALTEVMFHDVVNPPAAARFFSYSMLASYYVIDQQGQAGVNLSAAVKHYPSVKIPVVKGKINVAFAAIYAMMETGKRIIPSGDLLEAKQAALLALFKKSGEKKVVLDSSVAYANRVATLFAAYSKSDGYLKLSMLNRYKPAETDSSWYPTPPEYMAAVEPNWHTVRPFFMDSAAQFRPKPPTPFSTDESSRFYALMKEVYTTQKNMNAEQLAIARYWDCNPFANLYSGHVSIGIKKISPGGHWMSITGIACRQANVTLAEAVGIHAVVAMALHDAFISCWVEKYRTDRIRPKTAINRYIDENFEPLLETPPFPEYTSGHSVISSAAAEVLTAFLGDNFQFVDNTEVFFGLPERSFKSFRAAAEEAAISRLYGGIHFRDAIEAGQEQGRRIAGLILQKVL